jgi:hypothetical protein
MLNNSVTFGIKYFPVSFPFSTLNLARLGIFYPILLAILKEPELCPVLCQIPPFIIDERSKKFAGTSVSDLSLSGANRRASSNERFQQTCLRASFT